METHQVSKIHQFYNTLDARMERSKEQCTTEDLSGGNLNCIKFESAPTLCTESENT
jgi:hypothetical protein